MPENVAILGASAKPARYAYKAQVALLAHGHTPVPINPKYQQIDGIQCFSDLKSVSDAGVDMRRRILSCADAGATVETAIAAARAKAEAFRNFMLFLPLFLVSGSLSEFPKSNNSLDSHLFATIYGQMKTANPSALEGRGLGG